MKCKLILVLTAVHLTYGYNPAANNDGVIYQLNVSEYSRLPALFRLEYLDGCLRARGDKYCYFDGEILDGGSELHTLIKGYSANTLTHFNHSLIHWGVCVTQTCRQYYGNTTLEDALDACVNATLYESHQLQAKVIKQNIFCTDFGEVDPYDVSDYVVAAVFLTLLMLNVFGTAYDFISQKRSGFLSRFLLCFSVRQNWRKLVMVSCEDPKSKLNSLKSLNGIKAMTTLTIILGHSVLISFNAVANPLKIEESYRQPHIQILLNGTLVVQTFFAASGFLLAYNTLVTLEKRPTGWRGLIRGIRLRWLRLTPVYALVLAFVSTWLRHLKSGPLFKPLVNTEVVDCRRDWWLHMLYVDNYVDHSQCMPQTWYLSGDLQLSVMGMAIFYLLQSARARKVAITIAFVVGLLTPAANTFFQNLHAVLMVTPETVRQFFVEDRTFNNLYKRGHTNLVCYAMGLALGMLMYDMYGQEHTKNKKNRRLLYWAATPAAVGSIMLGMVFYVDGIEIPLYVRVVYSSAIKVCFGACMCGLIAGTLMKLDSVVRGILEWRGWTSICRISYCAYLIHVCVIRTVVTTIASLQHISLYSLIITFGGILGITYILSVPCWLFVESPASQFVKLCFDGDNGNKSDETVKAASPERMNQ